MDLIGSIPFDLMLDYSNGYSQKFEFRVLSILKMIRILRFLRLINHLNANSSIKLSLKLVKLVFYLTVYIHL